MGTHPSIQGSACLYTLVPRAAGKHVPLLLCKLCVGSIRTLTQLHGQLSTFQHQEGRVVGFAMSLQDP